MRVCGIVTHRAYAPDWSRYAVYLDGELVRDCVFADDAAGRVANLVVDPETTSIKVNEAGIGPLVIERNGDVLIRKTSLPLTDRYSAPFLSLFSKQSKVQILIPN